MDYNSNNQYNQNQQGQYKQPYAYQQNYQYQQPYPQPYQYQQQAEAPLTVGQWVGTLLLMLIPVVNTVMLFVWAFGNGHKDRSNFAKAELIISLILVAISIVLTMLGVSFFRYLYSF
ncbi:MAG: hypothetical protein IKE18_01780 [Oscillospiraceae bacterium]|nr:hypothetical protein [Oscillospiraceae bacterium]